MPTGSLLRNVRAPRGPALNPDADFPELLRAQGFDFFTGVPDSTFKKLLRRLESAPEFGYVPAVSENVAVGLAVGAWLGGRQPVAFMQNSGLALAINALASLAAIYKIPMLLVVGWRGHDGQDSPEHKLTGAATLPLLDALRLPYLVPQRATVESDLRTAAQTMHAERTPFALVCPPGVIE
jgi:sulfopyruvate decarboxylase subunit alpha